MVETTAPGGDRSASHAGRGGLFWAATAFGAATGVFAILVSLLVGMVLLDRHFSLPGVFGDVRYYVETIAYTRAFAVLYLGVPVVWVVLSVWWWLTRASPPRWVWIPVLVFFVAAGLLGAWAWFVTALGHIGRVFDVDGIPQGLGTFGLTSADRLDPLVVAGLSCLIVLVVANLAMMLYATARR